MKAPWLDRTGRFSPLKAATLALVCIPALLIAVQWSLGEYDARPLKSVQDATGQWAIRLLLLTLAVTPLRQVLQLPRLSVVRRMIGVSAFVYAAAHFTAYLAEKGFQLGVIGSELVSTLPLPIGLATLLALLALTATSTDRMVRRLGGKRWQALHRIVYGAGLLAVVHFTLEAKLDVTEPALVAGLLFWLMAYRVVLWQRGVAAATRVWMLAALSVGAAAATMLGEAVYLNLRSGAPIGLILEADLSLDLGLRPGWIVLVAGLATVVAAALRLRPVGGRAATAAAM